MKKLMALFGYVPKNTNTVEVDKQDMESIKKFLRYSFEPIMYKYENLSLCEKKQVSQSEFERILKIIQ